MYKRQLYDTSGAFSQKEMPRLISLIETLKAEGIGILISDNNPEAFFCAADRLVIFKHKKIAKKIYDRCLLYTSGLGKTVQGIA